MIIFYSLLNPVVYTPSQYPKSDAFEIISSMGSLISLHPTAQVIILYRKFGQPHIPSSYTGDNPLSVVWVALYPFILQHR